MRAVLTALLLCFTLPALAAASDQAPYPDPLDGMTLLRRPTPPADTLIKMRTAQPVTADAGKDQAPYLDPCQCVHGTPINRAPSNIYDPATTIRGEKPVGTPLVPAPTTQSEQVQDPYGAGRPLPPVDTNLHGQPPQPKGTEKPDRPIGMG